MSSSDVVLRKYDIDFYNITIKTKDDVLTILNNPDIAHEVANQEASLYGINISKCMTGLTTVGQLLRIASASSHGFNCGAPVMKIMNEYQRVLKDTVSATNLITLTGIEAISHHQYAYKLMMKGNVDAALRFLNKCAEYAETLVTISTKMSEDSLQLSQFSSDAIVVAVKELNTTIEKKDELTNKRIEYEANRKKMEAEISTLQTQISELDKEIADARNQEDERSKREFALAMIGAITSAAAKVAVVAAAPEVAAAGGMLTQPQQQQPQQQPNAIQVSQSALLQQMRTKMWEQERHDNASLAEDMSRLGSLDATLHTLDVAIASLDCTYKTMGKVTTVFERTRKFWSEVKASLLLLNNN